MASKKKFDVLRAKIDADPARRARVDAEKAEVLREQLDFKLAELRQIREITQVELAEALSTTQSGVSRMEHQADLHLSTLLRYVRALGGELEITAVFDDERIPIASG
jgi:hypothetical protein